MQSLTQMRCAISVKQTFAHKQIQNICVKEWRMYMYAYVYV